MRYVLVNYLLANTHTTEQEIMHEVQDILEKAIQKDLMIDIPLRNKYKNRHPDIVEELQYFVSVNILKVYGKRDFVSFEVNHAVALEDILEAYHDMYPALKETYETL